MVFIEILAILILALLLTALFNFGLRAKGPWGSFWTFFLVLLCGIWIVAIWVEPIGPVWYGAPWIDFVFVGILLALILAAATPPGPSHPTIRPITNRARMEEINEKEDTNPDSAIGIFFWMMILIFVIAIAAGIIL